MSVLYVVVTAKQMLGVLIFTIFCSPSFDLPAPDPGLLARKASIQCHYCNETGHKAANCPKLPVDSKVEQKVVRFVLSL